MATSFSYDEIDRIFRNDGYKLAGEYLGSDINTENFHELIRNLYHSVDLLLESFVSSVINNNGKPACKKGCFWCCSQAVFMNPWEADYLAAFINRNFSKSQREWIMGKAKEKERITTGLGVKKMLEIKHFCPLLDKGSCMAYQARPMACRIYLSGNVTSCIEEYENPSGKESFPALYDFPLHAGRMLNEGIADWLRERNLETRELSFEYYLTENLNNAKAFQNWLNSRFIQRRTF